MKKTNLIIIVSLVFFTCCNAPVKKQETTSSSIVLKDTIVDTTPSSIQRIDLEVEESTICSDTLEIVSVNCKLLYYPFGIYSNVENFLESLPKEAFVEKHIKARGTETFLVQIKNNYIEVLVGDNYCENNNSVINIVSAEIKDDVIEIVNCIKVGITRQSFFEILNLEYNHNSNEIKIVEIISALTGIWQYYTFDNSGTLTSIEIKSDYVFE